MASKVNVRFVVILSVVLGVVFAGVAATAFFVLMKSEDELERLGDRYMAESDYKRAAEYYGKAYHRDQSRIDRLDKYGDALRAYTPASVTEYTDYYWRRLMPVYITRATLLKTDIQAHDDVLGLMKSAQEATPFSRRGWEQVIDQTNVAIRFYQDNPHAPPGWERLRRYRGLARLAIYSATSDLTDEELAQGEADLRAALAADPSDEEVGVGLVNWYLVGAHRAAQSRRTETEIALRQTARTLLAEYRAARPESPAAALLELSLLIEDRARRPDWVNLPPGQRAAAMKAASADLAPDFERTAALVRAAGMDRLSGETVLRLAQLERLIRERQTDTTQAMLADAIALRPRDSELRFIKGRLAEERGESELAIAEYQAIIDLPLPPVSLEGMLLFERRIASMARQAESALAMWERAPQGERAAALERAVVHRGRLSAEVSRDSLPLLLIDAKIALAKGDYVNAQRMLLDHVRQTSELDSESVRLAGVVALQLNQPGEARDRFKRLTELETTSAGAQNLLGDVEMMLENHRAAGAAYSRALELDPANEHASQRLDLVRQVVEGRSATDPVVTLLFQADRLFQGREDMAPNRPQAIALLETALPQSHDIRIYHQLATYHTMEGNRDRAREFTARGLERYPDDPRLRRMSTMLEAPDDYTAMIAIIDEAPIPDAEKLIAKFGAARQARRADEARAFLDAAMKAAPDHPTVFEYRFLDALDGKNFADAKRLADTAASRNLDRVNGETYTARLHLAQGNRQEAISALGRATATGTATPETWRLMGQVNAELGRLGEASAALSEALRLRPTDINTILDYLRILVRLDQYDKALTVARAAEVHARASAEFVDLWMRLEATVGDKGMVIRRREDILRREPGDANNKLALLQAYIAVGEFAKSRPLLDELRGLSDALILVQLEARWHADQGDREAARRVFQSHIESRREAGDATPEAHVEYARFLMGLGDAEGGLAALEEGRRLQDPGTLEVDRIIGSTLFEMGRFEEALQPLERVLATGAPDPDHSTRARYIETLIRLQRFADAERAIDAAGREAAESLILTVLRSAAAYGAGDTRRARELIDFAIAKNSNEPLVYLRRAELLAQQQEYLDDAIEDLNSALRIDPNNWNALQMRAGFRVRQGRIDDAVTDLRAIVKGNPALAGPRSALFDHLMRNAKAEEAASLALQISSDRPRDVAMQISLGEFFSRWNRWDLASAFFARGWEVNKAPQIAVLLTRALLRLEKAEALPQVQQVLAEPTLTVDADPQLLMVRATLFRRQGMYDRSLGEAAKSLRLVASSPGDTSAMLDQLPLLFAAGGAVDTRSLVQFVQSVDMSALPEMWGTFFKGRYMYLDPSFRAEATRLLRQVVGGTTDPLLGKISRQFVSATLIDRGDSASLAGNEIEARSAYEEALEVISGVIEIEPDNAEALNNAAYVLVANLRRPDEALPFAERAAKLMPRSSPILDTLGLVYLRLGRVEEADKVLSLATTLDSSAEQLLNVLLNLMEVKIERGDRQSASLISDQVDRFLRSDRTRAQKYRARAEALRARIDSMR